MTRIPLIGVLFTSVVALPLVSFAENASPPKEFYACSRYPSVDVPVEFPLKDEVPARQVVAEFSRLSCASIFVPAHLDDHLKRKVRVLGATKPIPLGEAYSRLARALSDAGITVDVSGKRLQLSAR